MKKIHIIVGIALLIQTGLKAQNWTGAVSSDWNNAGNWSEWPLNGENITIDTLNYTGVNASPVLGAASVFTPDRLFVQNGALLTLGADLTVTGRIIIGNDAHVLMTNGTLITDRLIMELGGGFTLDAGTINTGRLVLGDDGTLPSSYVQHGGTVSVSLEFGFDCAVGPSTPMITLNAGTLTVNADAIWLGVAPSSGQGRFEVNGGSAQINGSLANTVGSTIDLLVQVNGGSLTLNGPAIDLAHATDSLQLSGGTCALDGNILFRNDGVVDADAGEVVVLGQAELRGIGAYRFKHLSIAPNASLLHTAPATIEVAGNWSNAGSFDGGLNTVVFTGPLTQTVESTTFFGLRVANAGSMMLSGASSVAGALTLDSGLVHTTPTDLLTILNTGTATGGSALSYVEGPLRKVGNTGFIFPVGKNGTWRRISIAGMSDPVAEFTAEYFDAGYPNTTSLEQGLSAVSNTEHWTLTRAVPTDSARVELFWENAAASNITDCDAVVVAQWNGVDWQGGSSSTTGSCADNDAGTVALDGPATSYLAFTFGTSDLNTGMNTVDRMVDLLPFPQPSDTWTMLPWHALGGSVRVLDQSGREVAVQLDRNGEGLRIHTASLPAGAYTVLLTAPGVRIGHARLIVVH